MNSQTTAAELLEKLEFLFEKYSQEMRASTQPYYLAKISDGVKDYKYHPEDVLIRESLLEHIGSLPMVATAIYPLIQDEEVDLGQSLIMLAIHDIGELITGDEITFTKKKAGKKLEFDAAITLLHPSYHSLYEDVESQSSKSAKFAKSIDKITPDILDFLTPADITIRRYKHFVDIEPEEIIDLIIKHKRPYMLWNPFMTEFHTLLVNRFSDKLKAAA